VRGGPLKPPLTAPLTRDASSLSRSRSRATCEKHKEGEAVRQRFKRT
jgi:hypothetical protein